MKKLVALVFTFFLACSAVAQGKPAKLTDLGWLAGCWEASKPDTGFMLSEQWMKPEGEGMMIGMGRTILERVRPWTGEFMRIEQSGDGLTFFAKPKVNNEETRFKMIRMSDSEVAFENLAHDFPQRVIYRLTKADLLTPSIEGTINGKSKAIEFPMQRVPCSRTFSPETDRKEVGGLADVHSYLDIRSDPSGRFSGQAGRRR